MIILLTDDGGISHESVQRWLSLDLADEMSTLVQVIAWHRSGDKPLSESMMA